MHKLLLFTGFAVGLAALAASFSAVGAIYKSVDEDGNVTYSDEPMPGAKKIEKKEIPTVPSTVPDVDFSTSGQRSGDEAGSAGVYDSIAIVSPENDTAVRENAGNLSVSIAIQPALKQNHQVVLYMDGEEKARSRSPVFQLSNIDRGTHTLTAVVLDSNGNRLLSSDMVTFTLLRQSRLQPNADLPGVPQAPNPEGPTPTNPPTGNPSGQNPVNPQFPNPTPTNPPKPRAQ